MSKKKTKKKEEASLVELLTKLRDECFGTPLLSDLYKQLDLAVRLTSDLTAKAEDAEMYEKDCERMEKNMTEAEELLVDALKLLR